MAISELELPSGVVTHSLPDPDQLARVLADRVAEALRYAINNHGCASLVVSGGRSPIAFFEALSTRQLDWAKVQVSLADERWVDVNDADSNEGLVRRHLLQNTAADAQMLGLYQPAETLEEAARLAGQRLNDLRQPIDVLVLGMGSDGHTASLFPNSPLLAQGIDPDGAAHCLPMRAPVNPEQRISMTYSLLASARVQCLAIQGSAKLETLCQAMQLETWQMPIRAFLHSPLEIYWCP
ncbi:6-phosphogluconolactonase [Stutzerimonas stutzeri]|uniref:6-phosphogluconolactonase n=1 Tax=Stutzerimonas stutzeri TaxID=316 RepID=W8QZR9_STUST|nr:6-phosphogluconolactonase [Stutzerimonas stutzeri]AHL75844.1 6-phosphogluconolactonase [Stutzerimonas stutzeri]MCQ4331212.1 6-phosphogluconolactonase [Stutzerimonas stutzeri]